MQKTGSRLIGGSESSPLLPRKILAQVYSYKSMQETMQQQNNGSEKDLEYDSIGYRSIPCSGRPSDSSSTQHNTPFSTSSACICDGLVNSFDVCVVLPTNCSEPLESGHVVLGALKRIGFDLVTFVGRPPDRQLYVLLRLPLETARSFAESIELHMLLDPAIIGPALEAGNADAGIAPVCIQHRPDVTPMPPYEQIYAPYRRDREHCYVAAAAGAATYQDVYVYDGENSKESSGAGATDAAKSQDHKHPFHKLIRLKLACLLLEQKYPHTGGADPGVSVSHSAQTIRAHLSNGDILACFPLHSSRAEVSALSAEWGRYPFACTEAPVDAIKQYFGEKIGLYFAFADHITLSLWYPAAIGLLVQMHVCVYNSLSGKPISPPVDYGA
jgi:hypothetical protein